MKFIDLKLKIRHFFRKYRKIMVVAIIIWAIVFLINQIILNLPLKTEPETSYEAHTSIMNDGSSTPKNVQKPIEALIEEYIGYLNQGNFQKAFDMLSESCREHSFNNDIEAFMRHVYTKMPTRKEYVIQNYSNVKYGGKSLYIYEVRYFDDIMATGLTNSEYHYTQENYTFYQGENGLEMNVGNYIYQADIKSISENEYLKVDVVDKVVYYSIETYEVKLTNRTNYTIVVADGQENDEVLLALQNETRKRSELDHIVLGPNESMIVEMTFPKFVDDSDSAKSLILSSVRVMEKYSGTDWVTEDVIQSEIDNAISKFSMEAVVVE